MPRAQARDDEEVISTNFPSDEGFSPCASRSERHHVPLITAQRATAANGKRAAACRETLAPPHLLPNNLLKQPSKLPARTSGGGLVGCSWGAAPSPPSYPRSSPPPAPYQSSHRNRHRRTPAMLLQLVAAATDSTGQGTAGRSSNSTGQGHRTGNFSGRAARTACGTIPFAKRYGRSGRTIAASGLSAYRASLGPQKKAAPSGPHSSCENHSPTVRRSGSTRSRIWDSTYPREMAW